MGRDRSRLPLGFKKHKIEFCRLLGVSEEDVKENLVHMDWTDLTFKFNDYFHRNLFFSFLIIVIFSLVAHALKYYIG